METIQEISKYITNTFSNVTKEQADIIATSCITKGITNPIKIDKEVEASINKAKYDNGICL